MKQDFWSQKWQQRELAFHRSVANRSLQAFAQRLSPYLRVYVPLCGKTLDLPYLRDRGHTVFGTEFVRQAVVEFFNERQESPETSSSEPYEVHRSTNFTLLCGDAFALQTKHLGGAVDAVFDRAALVALDPATRAAYVESLRRVLRPGGVILLVVYDYDQTLTSGPPWAVSPLQVNELFSPLGTVTLVDELNESASPRLHEAGVRTTFERTYWIEATP
jgi:thiopurine S-methyltransferase